jgi:serine/threonine protein kinase
MTTLQLTGQTIGHFDILAEAGRGGMGVVYQARQIDLDRIVALKVLPPELGYDTEYIARFRQEARNAARLEHPHIAPVYEIGYIDPSPASNLPTLHYIAMKYIDGVTLKEMIEQANQLSLAESIAVLEQIGAALDYAHQHGVLHRDIKPSNIMQNREGWVYLTDFGTARDIHATTELTRSGTVIGTPEYMAPEQARGEAHIGPAADIYALGVVLYEMLSGVFPFEADTPMGILAARLIEAPRPLREVCPDISPAVEAVVMRALATDPTARFANVAEMIATLQAAQAQGQSGTSYEQADRTLLHSSPAATLIVSGDGQNQQQSRPAQASSAPPAASRFTFPHALALLRTPLGLVTALLLLFLLIGGWFRMTSVPPITVPPTVTPPVHLITPTTPPLSASSSTVSSLTNEGWQHYNAGMYTQAETTFRQALSLNPRSDDALVGLGWTLREQEQYGDSVTAFKEALHINEQNYLAYAGLGWYLYDDNHALEAVEHFEQAITFSPRPDANLLYGLGLALEDAGRYNDAEEAYQQSLAIDGSDAEVQRALDRVSLK